MKLSFILAFFFFFIIFTGCERVENPLGEGIASEGVVITGGILTVNESGTSDSFTVALDTQPDSIVKICLNSSDSGEAVIPVTGDVLGADTDCSDARIEFDAANWNVPQTVTVTGVDDLYCDGNSNFTIILQNTISTGSNYVGVKPPNVTGTTSDNEGAAGINIVPATGVVIDETGSTAGISVSLNTQPESSVKICLASDTPAEAVVILGGDVQGPDADCSVASVQFGFSDYNIPKIINVQGIGDSIIDADKPYSIITTNISLDPVYSLIDPVDPSGINLNMDTVQIATLYTRSLPGGTFATIIGTGTDIWTGDVIDSSVYISLAPDSSFTFDYMGVIYTGVNISTKGFLSFGSPSVESNNQNLFNNSNPHRIVAPWWDNMKLNYSSAPNGRVQFIRSGTAPNRIFTVEWNNISLLADQSTYFTFQVILYEGTNDIQLVYDSATLGSVDSTASVGIKGEAFTASNFIDGLTGSSITGNSSRGVAGFPASGTIIQFQ